MLMTNYVKLNDFYPTANLTFIDQPLAEAEVGAMTMPRKITAIGGTADQVNANNHYYPLPTLQLAVDEAAMNMGKGIALTGQIDHPGECEEPELEDVAVNWTRIRLNNGLVELEGLLSPDKDGQKVISLMAIKMPIGISLRGYGLISQMDMGDGEIVDVITELHYEAFDFVLKPADANGAVKTLEAKKQMTTQVAPTGAPLTLADLKKEQPELVAQILAEGDKARQAEQAKLQAEQDALNAKLAEKDAAIRQAAGVDNDADLIQVLESQAKQVAEAKAIQLKADIEAALVEAVKGTKFPDGVNQALKESVLALNPKSADEAKAMVNKQLPIFNGLMAQQFMSDKGAVVRAPIVESNGSIPEYFHPTMRLVEGMQRRGIGKTWDINKPKGLSESFTQDLLLHASTFSVPGLDFKGGLINEHRLVEANSGTTSNLNLPYSVMMGIIAQAYPELIAPQLFTFSTMKTQAEYKYYESFVGETGKSVTVAAEAAVAASDAWVELAGARINFGSVVVTVAAVVKTQGDDYLIDYENGRIKTLSTGTIANAAALAVAYTYEAIRKGEGATIERGGIALARVLMEAKADRLASVITDEAMNFTMDSLNDNLMVRSIEGLVKDIQWRIDGNLLASGLTAALSVANNNAGTYTFGVDSLDKFAEKVGTAMSLVANRRYTPQWLLVSVTNGNKLANWKDFSALNARPGDSLRPDGMIGTLKGLSVYQSTLFTDGFALVGNKELVLHAVYKPMMIDGPHQVRDQATGLLIDSKEWIVREYNDSEAPIPQKGSYVTIA